MKVIFQNDDMGISWGVTEAIKDCCLSGITTSISIMTGGSAYEYAATLLKSQLKDIGVGLHLNLTDGKANVPDLADVNGNYRFSFPSLFYSLVYSNKPLLAAIEKEFTIQFEKVLSNGLTVDHVDSDKHVHTIPAIFKIVCQLCKRYKVVYIRQTREPYYLVGSLKSDLRPFLSANIVKFMVLNALSRQNLEVAQKNGLKTTDAVYGVLHTNYMDASSIKAAINDALRRGFRLIEIVGHPAYIDDKREATFISPLMERYAKLENRTREAEAFRDRSLLKFLELKNIQIVSYKNLN